MSAALLLGTAVASANLIAYNDGTPNHNRVMVMDDTGANITQIYEGGKFSGPLRLTVSPPGLDGTWVAYEDYHLYKVRTDGTDPTKMLCAQGTDSNGEPFDFFGDPQWSPDGSEILVSVLTEQGRRELALLPADSEVYSDATGEDCASPGLALIPYFAETREGQWELEGTAAWNDDGSQIAFFEAGPNDDWRLAILEQENGAWVLQQPSFHPDFPEISPFALDWQRGGSVLAFVSRIGFEARSDFWLTRIDVETGEWDFFTENGSPVEVTWDPTWSPESPSQHLIFTDSRGNLVKWTYPNGPGEVLGSGQGADWQRDALVLDCAISGCDDGDPCTVGTCEQSGVCSYHPASAGIACNDGDVCTQSDVCNESGQCIGGSPAVDGTSCDLAGSLCCSGICASATCNSNGDCLDGDSCTTDLCFGANTCAAYCQNDPIQGCSSCDPKGARCTSNSDCCSGQCHPRKGTCR